MNPVSVGLLETSDKDPRVLFVEEHIDPVEAALFLGVFPKAFKPL